MTCSRGLQHPHRGHYGTGRRGDRDSTYVTTHKGQPWRSRAKPYINTVGSGGKHGSLAGGGPGCCPRNTVWSGCARPTGCHPVPHATSMIAAEEARQQTPDPESDVWQQLYNQPEPATEDPPDLHQLVHQRPWTSSDANLRFRPVHGQIAGSNGVVPTTTDQKAKRELLH
jgi:hypothetical protein